MHEEVFAPEISSFQPNFTSRICVKDKRESFTDKVGVEVTNLVRREDCYITAPHGQSYSRFLQAKIPTNAVFASNRHYKAKAQISGVAMDSGADVQVQDKPTEGIHGRKTVSREDFRIPLDYLILLR